MDTGIGKAIKDGDGNAIIMTAVLAAAIANVLPTPMDSIYFSRQYKLKEDLEAGKITPEQYWWHDIGEYYLWTALWYAGIFVVLQAAGGTYQTRSRWLLALVSGGLVIGVAQKDIKRDKELIELKKQQSDSLSKGKVAPPSCSK